MEYTVAGLAAMSGVSARTLRYYDGIGLLKPAYIARNGYRIYGRAEVDRLQQILFYRAMVVPLEEIGRILDAPDFDKKKALESHLTELSRRKDRLEALIDNVSRTIASLKGEIEMNDEEKFEGLKHRAIKQNEAKYGAEVRERFGDDAMNAANAKAAAMSRKQWQYAKELGERVNLALREAFGQGDPAGEAARRLCALHREWLCLFWKDGSYTPEAHMALAEGYVSDKRFAAYYDAVAPGCAKFLRDAIRAYCGEASSR